MTAPRSTRHGKGRRVKLDLSLWGRTLRDFRQLRHLTQRELGEQITNVLGDGTIGQDAVSAWERGQRRPTDEQRVAIGAVLQVNPHLLFPYPEVSRGVPRS